MDWCVFQVSAVIKVEHFTINVPDLQFMLFLANSLFAVFAEFILELDRQVFLPFSPFLFYLLIVLFNLAPFSAHYALTGYSFIAMKPLMVTQVSHPFPMSVTIGSCLSFTQTLVVQGDRVDGENMSFTLLRWLQCPWLYGALNRSELWSDGNSFIYLFFSTEI